MREALRELCGPRRLVLAHADLAQKRDAVEGNLSKWHRYSDSNWKTARLGDTGARNDSRRDEMGNASSGAARRGVVLQGFCKRDPADGFRGTRLDQNRKPAQRLSEGSQSKTHVADFQILQLF